MAIFYIDVKSFGRARGKEGSSATSAAAYRSGERIRDERTGRTYDHSRRRDVVHKEIVLPSKFESEEANWARDRTALWNAAELAETRKNARVAREYLVALPSELTAAQRLELTRRFSQGLADRYQNAVDIAIHEPRPESDSRNFHAHLLTTTREITPDGLGLKTTLEIGSAARQQRGLAPAANEYLFVREQWADFTNDALQAAGLDVRVDHRTLEAQGIDTDPMLRIPVAAREIERRGERSFVADRIRAEHQRSLQAGANRAVEINDQPTSPEPQSLEDIRRQARENWLRLRRQQLSDKSAVANQTPALEQEESTVRQRAVRGRDDDLAF